MQENGCPATPNGRIYTWSTAHCIRALLSTFYHVPIDILLGTLKMMDLCINNHKFTIPTTYSHLQENIRRLLKDTPEYDRNIFIMMRYLEKNEYLIEIEDTIRSVLKTHGYNALFAKDKAYSDSLFDNIVIYMLGSKYGIVVFEEILERHFNPNVSLECGFMLALGKQILFLKDANMPRMPTDIVGRLYKDFDTRKYVTNTLLKAIEQWFKDIS